MTCGVRAMLRGKCASDTLTQALIGGATTWLLSHAQAGRPSSASSGTALRGAMAGSGWKNGGFALMGLCRADFGHNRSQVESDDHAREESPAAQGLEISEEESSTRRTCPSAMQK